MTPLADEALGGALGGDNQVAFGTLIRLVEEIAGAASKEYSLEKALDKMFGEWQPLEFMLKEYRDTGTCIMAGNEEVQALLDDHIVKSQTMQGSPSIKPFEERAKAWATKLVLIQDLIDIWLKVQGVWQYLEPIFGSEDIMRQMPEEGKLFKKQDGMWRENVKKVLRDVRVLAVGRGDEPRHVATRTRRLLDPPVDSRNEEPGRDHRRGWTRSFYNGDRIPPESGRYTPLHATLGQRRR